MLYYIILYFIILYYTILYYIILYYIYTESRVEGLKAELERTLAIPGTKALILKPLIQGLKLPT